MRPIVVTSWLILMACGGGSTTPSGPDEPAPPPPEAPTVTPEPAASWWCRTEHAVAGDCHRDRTRCEMPNVGRCVELTIADCYTIRIEEDESPSCWINDEACAADRDGVMAAATEMGLAPSLVVDCHDEE